MYSLLLRAIFQSSDHTLREEEVSPVGPHKSSPRSKRWVERREVEGLNMKAVARLNSTATLFVSAGTLVTIPEGVPMKNRCLPLFPATLMRPWTNATEIYAPKHPTGTLHTTHNTKDWFVDANTAVAGLTPEQANWKDASGNHSIGQLCLSSGVLEPAVLGKFKGEDPAKFSGDKQGNLHQF